MFALTIIGILVFIIAIIIYFEYKNEKEYQEERQKKAKDNKKTKPPKEKFNKRTETLDTEDRTLLQAKKTVNDTNKLKNKTEYVVKPRKVPSAKELREAEQKKLEKAKQEEQRLEEKRLKEQEQEQKSKIEEKINLPKCKYPKFDYSRLIKMGLSEDEAMEFIKELIPQIKTQIPLIKAAIEISDFNNIERLTHSIKGSSTTVGSGGISDLLVEFNTYVKTEKEIPILEAYLKHLKYYCEELEKEYA
jgi:HPt (histidine-containing phosphotransfer) domain-containing protein